MRRGPGRICHVSFTDCRYGSGRGTSECAQDRVIHPEEERAGKGSVGTEAQGGLASKEQEAENDGAHRARVRAQADPRGPTQVLPGHFK